MAVGGGRPIACRRDVGVVDVDVDVGSNNKAYNIQY